MGFLHANSSAHDVCSILLQIQRHESLVAIAFGSGLCSRDSPSRNAKQSVCQDMESYSPSLPCSLKQLSKWRIVICQGPAIKLTDTTNVDYACHVPRSLVPVNAYQIELLRALLQASCAWRGCIIPWSSYPFTVFVIMTRRQDVLILKVACYCCCLYKAWDPPCFDRDI